MKKVLLALLLVLALTACGEKAETPKENTKPVIKIGVSLPLTGPVAEIGNNSVQAIKLLLSENSDDKEIKYDFIIEDDTFATSRAATVANKLLNIDKVRALISSYSHIGNVISPMADRQGILHISVANDKNISKGKYNFMNWQMLNISARKLVDFLIDNDVKKVVSFNMNHAGCEEVRKETNKLLEQEGIEFVEYNFNPDNKDFSIMVAAALGQKADYWILNAAPPSLDVLRREMLRKNINIPVTNIQTIGMSNNIDMFEGQYFIGASDGNDYFRKQMAKVTKSKAIEVPAYIYDSINLLISAYEGFYKEFHKIPNSEELANKIIEMNSFDGIVGKLIINDSGIIETPSVLKQIINGQSVEVEE